MRRVLSMGMHMCIYPEGTRNRTQEPIRQFYDGAFKLAVDAKKDVIPCVITGTKKAMPAHKVFYLLPHRLGMQFLEPVSSSDTTAQELKAKVHALMTKIYVENSGR